MKCSDIQIIWVPEGEQKQEVENLFEKNNEGELPKSDEGNSLPRSPGSPENPEEVGPKEAHTKPHHKLHITQDESCLLYTSDAADDIGQV